MGDAEPQFDEDRERERRKTRRVYVVAAVIAAVGIGIGGVLATRGPDAPSNEAGVEPTPTGAATPAEVATVLSPTVEPAVSCSEDLTEFVDTLRDLNSRLGVGLDFSAYSEKVGDVRVAYDSVDWKDEPPECVAQVGIPAEAALNSYVDAYTVWNRCIGNLGCSNESIDPKLQREWRSATRSVTKAERALD